jgi:hypothetical protein
MQKAKVRYKRPPSGGLFWEAIFIFYGSVLVTVVAATAVGVPARTEAGAD